nr:transcriptional regulator ATRX homolog [Aegilops tauschii subsp. strangulata]
MPDNSDSQNKSEEQANLSEGTSPSRSYDEGSKSTPSNLPKAATRQRKKRNSESEDEDFVVDEKVTSKKKVIKKEQVVAAAIKPGMKVKAFVRRKPMSKVRASTQETMKFTLEQSNDDEAPGKKKKRAKTTTAKVLGRPAMVENEDEEEEEAAAPPPKSQKLMGDAIKSRAAPSKPKTAPKASAQAPKATTPKRSTRNIPAAEKNKAPVLEVQEDEEPLVLKKLKPKIPDHDDNHPAAEI